MAEENKFNFSEEETELKNKEVNVKDDAKNFFSSGRQFLHELLDFRDDTDREATIQAIKEDVPFKGATTWILICSIFVASVGLNANSTAVVIGAMLISPLMGPILGIGMSIAVNDIDTMRKSLISLATMVVLSLLTAFLFFYFFPLSENTSELFARTRPDIRDVLIAFFGGSALIIARTKKGTIASVIFGVAIATALMPPLCTAGFGLAKSNWTYFTGAMYLFTINTIFIALATFIVLKVLRFPMLKYANSKRRKRTAQIASLLAIIVMIPAGFTFVKVLQETRYNSEFSKFKAKIKDVEQLWLYDEKMDPDKKKITLFFNGEISEEADGLIRGMMNDYDKIKTFELDIKGNKTRSVDKISDALDRAYADIDKKDNIIDGLQTKITELEAEVTKLNRQIESKASLENQNYIAFSQVAKDAKIRYSDLRQLGFGKMLSSKDFIKIDTIPVAAVSWNIALNDSIKTVREKEFATWLKSQLQLDTLFVERIEKNE